MALLRCVFLIGKNYIIAISLLQPTFRWRVLGGKIANRGRMLVLLTAHHLSVRIS